MYLNKTHTQTRVSDSIYTTLHSVSTQIKHTRMSVSLHKQTHVCDGMSVSLHTHTYASDYPACVPKKLTSQATWPRRALKATASRRLAARCLASSLHGGDCKENMGHPEPIRNPEIKYTQVGIRYLFHFWMQMSVNYFCINWRLALKADDTLAVCTFLLWPRNFLQ